MKTKTEKPKSLGTKTDLKTGQNRKTENPNAPLNEENEYWTLKSAVSMCDRVILRTAILLEFSSIH